MRRRVVLFGAVGSVLANAVPGAHSAGSLSWGTSSSRMELLVFERADCSWCEAFRREISPRYSKSTAASDAPLRFVDIDKADLTQLRLRSRLTVLPTAVLMKDGTEVDRIQGYTGPEIFFSLMPVLMERAN